MDTLTNKTSLHCGYLSRYQGLYSYYDTVNGDTICYKYNIVYFRK